MNSNLHFRTATAADAPLLARLNRQLQEDERHRNIMEIAQIEPRMQKWLAGEYEGVVIEHDGAVVGYAIYQREEDFVYLKQFFVCRDARRRGIGRAAIDWLSANRWQDFPRVFLDALVQNDAGLAFWRAVGFTDYCITMERPVTGTAGSY
jgi:GNAT superfamily N-acetyltransferase